MPESSFVGLISALITVGGTLIIDQHIGHGNPFIDGIGFVIMTMIVMLIAAAKDVLIPWAGEWIIERSYWRIQHEPVHMLYISDHPPLDYAEGDWWLSGETLFRYIRPHGWVKFGDHITI